jgi:hypothetical protein
MRAWKTALAVLLASAAVSVVIAQRTDVFVASRDEPSIQYSTAPTTDPVARLNRALAEGRVKLAFAGDEGGYLRSVLDALGVPVESQVAVFTPTSFQNELITPRNPRTIYFSDSVLVAWVRGGALLEVAVQDPRQGAIFYSIEQQASGTPQFTRDNDCLACHLTWETLGVPGLMVLSTLTPPEDTKSYAVGFVSDHRSRLNMRWGGWYLTGSPGTSRHAGRAIDSLGSVIEGGGYPSLHSDVVALMVLEHQTRMVNLMTRLGWEARLAAPDTPARVRLAADDLVDYLFFVDEAPLAGPVKGSSRFAEVFAAQAPRDGRGRSLKDLDLTRRLLRYPCSYMIYTDAFDALPEAAADAVYRRMWEVLSGQDRAPRYAHLTLATRQAIVEILRETKQGLPEYFRPVTR